MASLLPFIQEREIRSFSAGNTLIDQGAPTSELLVLVSGQVEVLRDGVRVAKASEPGVVFGEMSALLGGNATATVRALSDAKVCVISEPRDFLMDHPEASLFVAELLAKRLDSLNRYLIDVQRQYEGHDHIGMVDEVLDSLMHRPHKPSAV
jgi:CRP-like cAMP-binding protein